MLKRSNPLPKNCPNVHPFFFFSRKCILDRAENLSAPSSKTLENLSTFYTKKGTTYFRKFTANKTTVLFPQTWIFLDFICKDEVGKYLLRICTLQGSF